jgi:hypothetical protein
MAYIPGCKYDVFISYAHFDNEADTQDIRWVSRFQTDLKKALRQRLGMDPDVFFDSRDLQAHHELDGLVAEVSASAVFHSLAELHQARVDHQGARGVRADAKQSQPNRHGRTAAGQGVRNTATVPAPQADAILVERRERGGCPAQAHAQIEPRQIRPAPADARPPDGRTAARHL